MTKEEALKAFRSHKIWDLMDNFTTDELQEMIDAIVSTPSLPSDLDEAARRYVTPPNALGIRTFKAGAEWMAGQGETREFEVYLDSLKTPDGTLYEYPACYMKLPGGVAGTYCVPENEYKEGDEVVVQIRKK